MDGNHKQKGTVVGLMHCFPTSMAFNNGPQCFAHTSGALVCVCVCVWVHSSRQKLYLIHSRMETVVATIKLCDVVM